VKLGFTGTRKPLTAPQRTSLGELVASIEKHSPIHSVHHGDCIGADAAFDKVCYDLGLERHSHPGPEGPNRAHTDADVVHEERWFLDRNRDIVDVADVLIACPYTGETQRSGTWTTIRYARRRRCQVIIVWPDGTVERE
jgi:hypothetical protein